jgi:DMSO/TMAO reductase YedYZ heme-binding membrane subunit
MLVLGSYSVAVFVFLSEILMTSGAAWLSRMRGERWTKEIDYLYLGLGAFGLIASLSQLQNVSDKFIPPSILAPFLVATAIVLRAIKTRAEIGAWSKRTR